jgi:hypothetical protein
LNAVYQDQLRPTRGAISEHPQPDSGSLMLLLRRLGATDIMPVLRVIILFVFMLALTGCPGPNYAPYDNMTNSYG